MHHSQQLPWEGEREEGLGRVKANAREVIASPAGFLELEGPLELSQWRQEVQAFGPQPRPVIRQRLHLERGCDLG